jgi:hypothetical protein
MAQASQGIDAAQSNMPTAYAGGGIVAFADNEDQPVSRYMPSTRQYDDSYVPADREGMQKTGFLDFLIPEYKKPEDMSEEEYEKSKRPAYTAPKAGPLAPPSAAAPGSRRETAPAPGTGSVAPPVVEKKPEEEKKPPELKVERGDSKPALGPSQIFGALPTDNSGIADFMKKRETSDENLKKLILGDAKDKDKQLQIQTLLKIMGSGFEAAGGTSPHAMANIGPAAAKGVTGIGELYAQREEAKQKQVGQLVALGLKGQELDAELVKLGITKDYYDSHRKLFEAQADYYRRRPSTTGSAGLGYVGQAQAKELMQEYLGYMAKPQSAPFFAQLPKDVQRYLKADPSSPSYANAMGEFDRYAKAYRDRQADFIRQNSAKFPQAPYSTEP